MIAVVLPAIITGKLHVDTKKKLKNLLEKFVRATCYIAWAGTIPWLVLCIFSKFGMIRRNSFWVKTSAYSAGMIGVLFEPLYKHSTYVGFYVPKAIECLSNIVQGKKAGAAESGKSLYLMLLMCGLIGLCHSRGHYEKE